METTDMKKNSSNMLAPGFRFHPTDEELVRYYLRRKVCGKGFQFDAISEIDIYKAEPWDLPSLSKLKTRDLEWYFFSVLDRKYGNGARTNRSTEKGYWKTTGKDRAVYHKSQAVGMKKTLVYHSGRAPKGQRSNWVMHEYRLVTDLELERAGMFQDGFVLCRVFQKSGAGPKNGEQYGAPFVEEEWEANESDLATKEDSEEVDFVGDLYLGAHDLEQILGSDVTPSNIAPPLLKFQSVDGSHVAETTKSVTDIHKLLASAENHCLEPEQADDTNLYDMPAPCGMDRNLVNCEYTGESSKSRNPEDVDYMFNEEFLDFSDYLPFGDDGFIETNDLSNPVQTNTSEFDMLDEYLMFFDANDNNFQLLANDTSTLESEDHVSDQTCITPKELNVITEPAIMPTGQTFDNSSVDAAASVSNKQEPEKYQTGTLISFHTFPNVFVETGTDLRLFCRDADSKKAFIKRTSQMLGSIPAPPAFAVEFPSEEASLHCNSALSLATSVHVTTGMIQLQGLFVGNNVTAPSSVKPENMGVILSLGVSRHHDGSINLESCVSIHARKIISSISRDWLYFLFIWISILSISFKLGMNVCAW